MPASVSYDLSTGIWTIRLSGVLTMDEAVSANREMTQRPGYNGNAPRIWDARDTDAGYAFSASQMRALATLPENEKAAGRVAILIDRDLEFGISRMFQAYSESRSVEVQVFREHDEAVAWLMDGE